MWQETESVVGYLRFVAKFWVFVGPVPSAKVTISDWKDQNPDDFQLAIGDHGSVRGLFENIKEACRQNNTNGWTVMLSLHKSAVAVAQSKSSEQAVLDVIDDEVAAEVESQIENYGVF